MPTEGVPERLAALLGEEPAELVAAYLFGSFGRGEAREHSDVDLGLLYRSEPPRTFDSPASRLAGRLERELRRYRRPSAS